MTDGTDPRARDIARKIAEDGLPVGAYDGLIEKWGSRIANEVWQQACDIFDAMHDTAEPALDVERDVPPTIPTYSFNQTLRELRRLSEAYYAWAEAHEDIDFGPASDAFEWGNLLLNAADALDAAIDPWGPHQEPRWEQKGARWEA